MIDRVRRSSATISLAAILAATAWLAGPSLAVRAAGPSSAVADAALEPPAAELATIATSMELSLLTWLNRDRSAIGLRPLRRDTALAGLADDRAGRMAGLGVLSHDLAGGDIGAALAARGVVWYRFAENIGTTTALWGPDAASYIYRLWRDSPSHWAEMTSGQLNYIGIAVAYRPTDGSTYASLVFTESPDRTPPIARMTSARALTSSTGTAAVFTWRGSDPLLQTQTAGLRDFDVQYRVDAGSWRLLRNDTTATSITLARRPPGHSYWLRVRARDRQGNVSAWSKALRVVVP